MTRPYRDGMDSDALWRSSIRGRESKDPLAPGTHEEVTTTVDDTNDKVYLDVKDTGMSTVIADDPCHGPYLNTRNTWGPRTPSSAMAFHYIIEHLLTGIPWTRAVMTGDEDNGFEQLDFYNGSNVAKSVRITCNAPDNWVVAVDIVEYILQEDGDFLLQENSDRLIL